MEIEREWRIRGLEDYKGYLCNLELWGLLEPCILLHYLLFLIIVLITGYFLPFIEVNINHLTSMILNFCHIKIL